MTQGSLKGSLRDLWGFGSTRFLKFAVSSLKLNIRVKGTLVIKGLLRNLVMFGGILPLFILNPFSNFLGFAVDR